jgi:hypothetical protein
MEVETVFHSSVKADEPISGSKEFWNRRVTVLWVKLGIRKYCKCGILTYAFPSLLKHFQDRQNSIGWAQDDVAAAIESHSKVLGSREYGIPVVEDSQEVVEGLKLIVVLELFFRMGVDPARSDKLIIQVFFEYLQCHPCLTFAFLQLLASALTE